ncbi:MAG: hemolysin III family protein [Clostridia bacterium]|nr:hemolysin III family protein [Clostridia bacterium]
MKKNKKYEKFYTLGEEIANAVTHGVASALAIAATVVVIVFAGITRDPWKIVSASIYGFSMILLYTMSTLYHSFPVGRTKAVFRVFDHASIFILIAGSYTPFTLVTLRGPIGWILFGVTWGSAVIGVTLNAISVDRFDKLSLACYVASGWCVVFTIKPLIDKLAFNGLMFLVAGGVMYTAGIVFYKLRRKYMHSIWHVFVFLGTLFQYFCILFYVIMA